MRIRYAAKTDVGMKRNHNEDYFSLIEDEQLFLVADGMGGHASRRGRLEDGRRGDQRVLRAHQGRGRDLAVQDGPHALLHREPAGLRHQAGEPAHLRGRLQGHHATRAWARRSSAAWSSATRSTSRHVGDSRCYRVRDGGIQQLTRDHSLLEDYKEAKPDMTEEEQRNFPHKNVITRALGMRETVQVDMLRPRHPGRRRLPAVLRRPVGHGRGREDRSSVVKATPRPRAAVAELVDAANRTAAPTTSPCWRCSARTENSGAGNASVVGIHVGRPCAASLVTSVRDRRLRSWSAGCASSSTAATTRPGWR